MSPRVAVTVLFAFNGFLFGTLYSRMPALRDGLELSNGQLGLALLAVTLSLVVTAAPAGALVTRFGSRPVVLTGAVIAAAGLVLIGVAPTLATFAVALAIYGAGAALIDIPMNIAGIVVEQNSGKRIFGSLHAGFSFGALAGTLIAAAAAAAGLAPDAHFALAVLLGLAAIAAGARAIPDGAGAERGALFARPSRALALVGFVAFCCLFAEGSISDWGAIFLHDEHATSEALAAAGLGVMSVTLGLGRLATDPLSERYGSQLLIRVGGLIAAAAMIFVLVAPSPGLVIAGLLVLGIGLAPVFPMTLRAAGAHGPAMAVATGSGYAGLMAGPPLIGGLAEVSSLSTALIVIVVCCIGVSVLAPRPLDN